MKKKNGLLNLGLKYLEIYLNKYGEYKGSNEIAKTLPFFSTVYDIDRALNNTRTGKNVGLNIFNADNYNWDIDQIK